MARTTHSHNSLLLLLLAAAAGAAVSSAAPLSFSGALLNSTVAAGSFRKDYYLPKYKESVEYPTPTDGGRVHITVTGASACTAQPLTSVKINGQEALNLPSDDSPDFKYFDWARAHQDASTGVVWVSFHSRNTDWFPSTSATLQVDLSTKAGACFSGKVSVDASAPVQCTSVTTRNAGSQVIVHLHNPSSSQAQTVSAVTVNGNQVASNVAVEAGQTSILTVPAGSGSSLRPGQIWSVAVHTGTLVSAWGGRVLPEEFIVQAWPHSDDCPISGVNKDNAQEVISFGINAIFQGGGGKCGDPSQNADRLASTGVPMRLSLKPQDVQGVKNRSAIASVFIGDEVDGKMDKNLRDTRPRQANQDYPELPTYQGAKTNAHVGSYSGITDIQGMDAYAAACAPTIVPVIHSLPLNYPYLYLRNTRDNHMPLPTWLYSQLYSDAWSYQANENELVSQIAQTVIAGAKGVTLFQSYHDQFKQHAVGPIKQVLQSIRGLGEDIRAGDIGGAIVSGASSDVMVGTIRSPDRLIVVLLNMNAKGYSNLSCHIYVGKHWTFHKTTTPKLTVTVPSNVKLSNPREQIGQSRTSVSGVDVSGNVATLDKLDLDDKNVARFIIFDVAQ